jgi:agmatinase
LTYQGETSKLATDHATPNFGALSEAKSCWEHSQVVLFSAPFGQSLSYRKGAENGPRAVLEASRNLELFDLELTLEPSAVGIHTFPLPTEQEVSSFHSMDRWVYQTAKAILDSGKFPVLVGGEHSVSLGNIRRAAEVFDKLSVLCLDAHADMRDEYEGNRFSHACVMRRCMDMVRPVLVGIRSLAAEEYEFLSETDIFLLPAGEFLRDEGSLERLLGALSRRVYLSVDLDVLDPSEMPSVGTPEPGGLSWYDVLRIIRRVAEEKEIVAADFVELSPIPDNVGPDFLAAKLIYKTIGYVFFCGKPR